MKTILQIIFFSIFIVSCKEDKYNYNISDFRKELRPSLKSLSKEKSLPAKDTVSRNFLEKNATNKELIKLMNSKNPLLRVIAYRSIVNRKAPEYFNLLLGHLSDTIKVEWWYYEDAGGDFTVSDLLIRKAENSRLLTQKQKNILVDSVLLKHPYLDVSNWMIQDINPNEKYYSLIKKRAEVKTTKCGEQLGACYALSKFKKDEDLEFLKSIFNNLENPCEDWIFKSIEENPNSIYFPILEKYFEQTIRKKKQFSSDDLEYYCRAIAKYKNDKSLALLIEILDKKNYPDTWYFKYNEQNVFRAIHKYRTPLYDSLYINLKPKMSDFVIEYLDKENYKEIKTW